MWRTSIILFSILVVTNLQLKGIICEVKLPVVVSSQGIPRGKEVNSTRGASNHSVNDNLYAGSPVDDIPFWNIKYLGGILITAISQLCNLLFQMLWVTSQDEFPIVTLRQGVVKGKKVYSASTAPYYSFEGIPYAKPPLGELRFKAPVDPEPWDGIFEALQEGSECSQFYQIYASMGKEDCLFINVYTPELPGPNPLKPVMVWIHGGSFNVGSGSTIKKGPQYLLKSGVVFVSFNYRLGVFGFFSTGDSAAPGNAGLKDQVQALRWVQNNIAAFGGDPNKVTIFGVSAGGASVQFHMLSPMSKGLFQGAIAMSGSAINTWAMTKNPKQFAFRLANFSGISVSSTEELVETLRKEDSLKLLTMSALVTTEYGNVRIASAVFLPTVEPYTAGEQSFLSEHPQQLLEQGKINDVPFMTGTTSHEGILLFLKIHLITNSSTISEIDENLKKVLKHDLRFCYEDTCEKDVIPKIRAFYFADKAINNGTYEKHIQLCTDMYFTEGTLEAANLMSSRITSPVYMYQFSYVGELPRLRNFRILRNIQGASHEDDTKYLFQCPSQQLRDEMDLKTRSKMVTLWTNFAKTGNPTPGSTEDIPTWPPYKSTETKYLNIGSQLDVKESLNKDRMEFWHKLYASIKR